MRAAHECTTSALQRKQETGRSFLSTSPRAHGRTTTCRWVAFCRGLEWSGEGCLCLTAHSPCAHGGVSTMLRFGSSWVPRSALTISRRGLKWSGGGRLCLTAAEHLIKLDRALMSHVERAGPSIVSKNDEEKASPSSKDSALLHLRKCSQHRRSV